MAHTHAKLVIIGSNAAPASAGATGVTTLGSGEITAEAVARVVKSSFS